MSERPRRQKKTAQWLSSSTNLDRTSFGWTDWISRKAQSNLTPKEKAHLRKAALSEWLSAWWMAKRTMQSISGRSTFGRRIPIESHTPSNTYRSLLGHGKDCG